MFCYDTGHNLINNSDYISNLNDRLEIIHLSDNNGIDDSHLGIGRGILHENEIKKLLSVNAKYLILEINHNHIKETIDILDKIKKGYDIPLFNILKEGSICYEHNKYMH